MLWTGESRLIAGGLMRKLSELHAAPLPVIRASARKIVRFPAVGAGGDGVDPAFAQNGYWRNCRPRGSPSGALLPELRYTITDADPLVYVRQ